MNQIHLAKEGQTLTQKACIQGIKGDRISSQTRDFENLKAT